jgi:hypothetical protein
MPIKVKKNILIEWLITIWIVLSAVTYALTFMPSNYVTKSLLPSTAWVLHKHLNHFFSVSGKKDDR